jgi:hypothetical protein
MTKIADLFHKTCSIRRLVFALAIAAAAPSAAWAYDDRGPSPDMAAWEVFAQAVAPSGAGGANDLEFETWASDDDMFGQSPPRWPGAGEPPRLVECKGLFDRAAAKAAGFPDDGCIREEVRRNWAAFRYFASHDLTSKTGLAKAFEQGLIVDPPADSVQVKADWVKISDLARWVGLSEDDVRRIYHTRIDQDNGVDAEYALVALHLNSKRWKNWIWATFEHRLNPGRCDDIGCHDAFGAATADVVPQASANQNYGDCPKTPPLIAIFANVGLDPVWLNYCLKGSQVGFLEKDGRPRLLGNSVIDRINGHIPIAHSSCMACHALASFNRSGEANTVAADNAVGEVDQSRLRDFLQNGFVWGVAKAK